jgi:hypothetical protein
LILREGQNGRLIVCWGEKTDQNTQEIDSKNVGNLGEEEDRAIIRNENETKEKAHTI